VTSTSNPGAFQTTTTTDYSSQTAGFNFGWIFGLGDFIYGPDRVPVLTTMRS